HAGPVLFACTPLFGSSAAIASARCRMSAIGTWRSVSSTATNDNSADVCAAAARASVRVENSGRTAGAVLMADRRRGAGPAGPDRSEEHTSELQSRDNL